MFSPVNLASNSKESVDYSGLFTLDIDAIIRLIQHSHFDSFRSSLHPVILSARLDPLFFIMNVNRARVRNVFIYNGATGDHFGGMRQNGSITEAVFLWILSHILLITDAELEVKARASQQIILPTSNRLEPGDYDVYCNGKCYDLNKYFYDPTLLTEIGSIKLTNEPWVLRILSHSVSGREESFREGLRKRDGKCVLSGFENLNADIGDWSPFEGAHIFPLEKENIWITQNFGRWITDMDYANGVSKINSCQNGLLLRRDLHTMFDNYLISVNPDVSDSAEDIIILLVTNIFIRSKDGYKIIVFNRDIFGLDGRVLDPVCRNPRDLHRVSDELLRWHFRQSVLANMRGAGEPIFEHDFPAGTDMMREIYEGPSAQERFEMEIASRLRGFEI